MCHLEVKVIDGESLNMFTLTLVHMAIAYTIDNILGAKVQFTKMYALIAL